MDSRCYSCVSIRPRSFAAAVILGVVYGIDLENEHDTMVHMVTDAAKSAELIIAAGAYLGNVRVHFRWFRRSDQKRSGLHTDL